MLKNLFTLVSISLMLLITACNSNNTVTVDETCIQLPGSPLPAECAKKS